MDIKNNWLCKCGERHTGHPMPGYPDHAPADIWEARMAIGGMNTPALARSVKRKAAEGE